jgi:hypothetical protein
MDRTPNEGRRKIVLDVEDDGFLLALIAGYWGEVLSDTGRHLHLRWELLADLVGEALLIKRVKELPDPPEDADADTLQMLVQARRYATSPETAAQKPAE